MRRVWPSVAVFLFAFLPIPASAVPVYITYSGVLTTGNLGAQSLIGQEAQVTFFFNTQFLGTSYTTDANSSSLVCGGPNACATLQVVIPNLINIGGSEPGGSASDQATVGNTQQSFFVSQPQFGEVNSASASASNPAIPASILQHYFFLHDIGFSVQFSFIQTIGADFNFSGSLDFGDFLISDQFPPAPLPTALPLFATGLGAMGLLGWRRKRKAQAIA